jgi:hypothetical protein
MTEEELNKLAFRRRLVIENITSLKERVRCLMNTLDGLNDRIIGLENAYQFINMALIDHFEMGGIPKVEVIKIFDERNKEKFMLKIDIDTDGSTIYKVLQDLELALYFNSSNNIIDKMAFIYRCQEIACEYLKSHLDISSAVNNMSEYVDEVLPRFIESDRIERLLMREIDARRRV